ncbi:MAG: NAD(P)/FAD-dependent oxidoreductase [Candidatus Acidiferrales bacterium]
MDRHKVVILGGGFGGINAAKNLKNAPVEVKLVDRCNFHLFQPLLYQVATGSLSPANIAGPLRQIVRKQKNTQVLLAEAVEIDAKNRRVILSDGELPYDTLVVATGSTHQYFGHPEWEQHAPGLKTIEDATAMRARILTAFEAAERETHPEKLAEWMTFVIVGGGPTGAELAGALGEIAHDTLKHDFRDIDPSRTRIVLVEGADRVLPSYPPKLSDDARKMLNDLGVTVRTGAMVIDIQADKVIIKEGDKVESIPTRTVLWAAGVLASPLGVALAKNAGAPLDKANRVLVAPDCTVPGHPEIFVIGDLANFSHQTGQPLPGVAQPALQQGQYVAKVIRGRFENKSPKPFHYFDKGNLATIGRGKAVADLNFIGIAGWSAWFMWIFIHLIYLIEFKERLLVLTQWAWLYITWDRSARLITGKSALPLDL